MSKEVIASQLFDHIDRNRFKGQPVGVALGGVSHEREISLKTGHALADALSSSGYAVHIYDIAEDLLKIAQDKPSAMVLATHGGIGENGVFQGYLEALAIPYTGSGVLASAVAMDKARAKCLFECNSIPVASGFVLSHDVSANPIECVNLLEQRSLSLPVVAKLNSSGSSVGVYLCRTADELVHAIDSLRKQLSNDNTASASDFILIESYLAGPEYSVGFFDDICLGAIKVIPAQGFYDFDAKYNSGTTTYEIVEDKTLFFELERLAKASYKALGCRGVARIDMMSTFFDAPHDLRVLEVNTIPGMTATSLVPMLAKNRGISFPEFAELMLASASLENNPSGSGS